ncbi:2,3-diaminopropionate biosynthesis protein SbnB [Tistrella mobilis]|uniref:2,3-diaminopropionate biosynthesis protein SbnB n=1 Tax=Tistrella mobilis TaxID=171437 RepID=UPI0035584B18
MTDRMLQPAPFTVIGAEAVRRALAARPDHLIALVRDTYLAHDAGLTVNPDSYFLRFPDRPGDRIIALPAAIGGDDPVSGIKWIASFPGNLSRGIDRASAVLVLNDAGTGYPVACLESSIISAARTAASAVLGAELLHGPEKRARQVAVIGTGPIARAITDMLFATGWQAGELVAHDLDLARATAFADAIGLRRRIPTRATADIAAAISQADLVIFATTAGRPHVLDAGLFAHAPTVLHISLRDLGPEVILSAWNLVDDVDHALKADTSLHLVEKARGDRGFVAGTIADAVRGRIVPDRSRPRIFSPFGMGILDLALGLDVWKTVTDQGGGVVVPDFFPRTATLGL